MDSQEASDPDTDGVAVRVLLPDGGQMEAPEEEGEETESEVSDEAEVEESDEERAGAAQDEPEGEEAEGEDEEEMGDEATEGEEGEADEEARILHLDLDGLFLDLLGLEVDLDTVTLDVTAVPGESKLLGNLLSAVSGLLDGNPLSSLLPENPLSGLFGGGEGDEEGEGSGLLPDVHPIQRAKELAGSLADAIRGAFTDAGKSIVAALPLEELLAQFLQAVVNQLLDTADDGGDEAEAEEAAASA